MGRSCKLEYLDMEPPPYTAQEYRRCLKQLGRIGRLLGGDRATLEAIDALGRPPDSILDVGCGGGDFAATLAKTYPHAEVEGIDLSEPAIAYANEHWGTLPNLKFAVPKDKELSYPDKRFDIVTATLVCHHMPDAELIEFLRQARRVASRAVIINDLHRHPLATISFAVVAPLLFPNRLILHDGLISIRRAFTRRDWKAYLDALAIPESAQKISWSFAFRWMVTLLSESTTSSLAEELPA